MPSERYIDMRKIEGYVLLPDGTKLEYWPEKREWDNVSVRLVVSGKATPDRAKQIFSALDGGSRSVRLIIGEASGTYAIKSAEYCGETEVFTLRIIGAGWPQ